MKTATIKNELEYEVKKYEREVEAFTKGMLENPAHTLEYSNDMFQTAARLHVAKVVLKWIELDEGNFCEIVRERANGLLTNGARFPQASTSQPSNLMHLQVISAWGRFVVEYLND